MARGSAAGHKNARTEPEQPVRLDAFLWAIRAYKTRPAAAAACRAGHVKLGGGRKPAKAAHPVRPGDRITYRKEGLARTMEVLALTAHRLPARSVPDFAEDVTPPEEIERARDAREQARQNDVFADAELADSRPTKRDRRQWEKFLKSVRH